MRKIGVFETIFNGNKMNNVPTSYFKMLNGYSSVFTTYEGGSYEMELTRSVIHSFATVCSKLKPEINGNAYKKLEKILQFKPNPFMYISKFIYKIATILSVNNTA